MVQEMEELYVEHERKVWLDKIKDACRYEELSG